MSELLWLGLAWIGSLILAVLLGWHFGAEAQGHKLGYLRRQLTTSREMLQAALDTPGPPSDSSRAIPHPHQLERHMPAPEMDRLKTEVTEATDVMLSAKLLIEGLGVRLREAIDAQDPVALNALADELDVNANDLAAAVVANT